MRVHLLQNSWIEAQWVSSPGHWARAFCPEERYRLGELTPNRGRDMLLILLNRDYAKWLFRQRVQNLLPNSSAIVWAFFFYKTFIILNSEKPKLFRFKRRLASRNNSLFVAVKFWFQKSADTAPFRGNARNWHNVPIHLSRSIGNAKQIMIRWANSRCDGRWWAVMVFVS